MSIQGMKSCFSLQVGLTRFSACCPIALEVFLHAGGQRGHGRTVGPTSCSGAAPASAAPLTLGNLRIPRFTAQSRVDHGLADREVVDVLEALGVEFQCAVHHVVEVAADAGAL